LTNAGGRGHRGRVSSRLATAAVSREMLARPSAGHLRPDRAGPSVFPFFAALAEYPRRDKHANIREGALETLDAAARRGKHGGRPLGLRWACYRFAGWQSLKP
jgi:hypothetical protein